MYVRYVYSDEYVFFSSQMLSLMLSVNLRKNKCKLTVFAVAFTSFGDFFNYFI